MATGGAGEMLASAVVKELSGKLGSVLWAEIGLLANFKADLDAMKETMAALQAVLKDAERRSLRKEGEGERLWLKRIKSAAFDIEDLLSSCESAMPPPLKMDRRCSHRFRREVRMFFSPSNQVILYVALAYNMKKMRERLDKIFAERRNFHFKVDNSLDRQAEIIEIKNRETFSEIDKNHETTIIGRKDEKEEIISFLLQEHDEEDVSIIPIVGLGGLGKTTLAQLVFNDESVKSSFSIRAWVYVSLELDLLSIGKAILSQIDDKVQINNDLQSVTSCLKRALDDKRWLIILDDLWEEDGRQLEQLKLMLKGGTNGSKIVVTTRSQKVAMLVASRNVEPHHLSVLSDEDCWIVFSQRAFVSGSEANSSLVEIGWEIVKKCKGVPLAAKVLGYIMRTKEGIAAWSGIRDSNFWELEDDDVLPSLKLSYYHMPSPLKLCFAYCAIFHKGCEIDKEKLIWQWIALGFVKLTSWSSALENIGEEYVKNLLWMCFLQGSTKQASSQRLLNMHDLVHDLARSVMGDEILVIRGGKEINATFSNKDCHFALVESYNESSRMIYKALPKKLRALHLRDCRITKLPSNVFSQVRCLRVLDLSGCYIKELPDSINQLKQLRYLDASDTPIQTLDQSICGLSSLYVLCLSNCSIELLPSYIGALSKLCYLNLHGCSNLQHLPETFTQLESLTFLDISDCCNLRMLPESFGRLLGLQSLYVSGCSELMTLPESLSDLEDLVRLDLSGCSSLKTLPESFGNLCKLQFLHLSGCSELQLLPGSITNLKDLLHLDLSDCSNLQMLPESFGMLSKLSLLRLSGCSQLQILPKSFIRLTNLENLDLSYCSNLKELPKSLINCKKLQSLELLGCSSLNNFPRGIEHLVESKRLPESQRLPGLFECNEVVGPNRSKFSSIVKLEHLNQTSGELRITCLENLQDPGDAERAKLCNKSKLFSLILEWSVTPDRLVHNVVVDHSILDKLRPHRNLMCFTLDGYSATQFPGWMRDIRSSLPNLVQIKLCNLVRSENLPPLAQLENLLVLEIENSPSIKKLDGDLCGTGSRPFKKLKKLSIRNMPNLEEFWTIVSRFDRESMFPCLENLEVVRCPNLRFKPWLPKSDEFFIRESNKVLSSGNIRTHTFANPPSRMFIVNCEILPSNGWKVLGVVGLETLVIMSCDELSTLPEGIRALTSLKYLVISRCNNLEELPEWLGDLTSLKGLFIDSGNNLVSLPRSIQNLTALEKLSIHDCSKVLVEWSMGENITIFAHVPFVKISELCSLFSREDEEEEKEKDDDESMQEKISTYLDRLEDCKPYLESNVQESEEEERRILLQFEEHFKEKFDIDSE